MKLGEKEKPSLIELALLFLKLGTTAFGGPAAHIAMMKLEIVDRRKWLSEAEFLDYIGATNLIPGPNSTELAIHIGHHRRGWAGLLVAGSAFIIPAALIVWAIAWAYVRFGALPEASGALYGIKPVVFAIVIQAIWSLGRSAIKNSVLAILAVAALAATAAGVNEILLIFLTGFAMIVATNLRGPDKSVASSALLGAFALKSIKAIAAVTAGIATTELPKLFLIFLKIGSVLFGSGYVLLAFLKADFVDRLHWLTESQLLDAIAIGQFTPGPVFTTATFIGYLLAGNSGALLATLGIFLPAFFFVAISAPLIPKIRKSPIAGAFLDGVNVASLALMACVTYKLGAATIVDTTTVAITLAAAALLFRFRLNSAWLVIGGGTLGLLRALVLHS